MDHADSVYHADSAYKEFCRSHGFWGPLLRAAVLWVEFLDIQGARGYCLHCFFKNLNSTEQQFLQMFGRRLSIEADLSAKSKQARQEPRVSKPHENDRWTGGSKKTKGEGPEETFCLVLSRPPCFPLFIGGAVSQKFRSEMKIRRDPEFKRVLSKGKKRKNRYFTLHFFPGEESRSRLGVIASRHTGNAVSRNRAKRLLREVFRRHYPKLPTGTDFVAVARRPIASAGMKEVEKVFLDAIFSPDR
jgi:ribonuclease P protein component